MKRLAPLVLAAIAFAGCQDVTEPPVVRQVPLRPAFAMDTVPSDRFIVVLDENRVSDLDGEAIQLSNRHGARIERLYRHALKGMVVRMSDDAARAMGADGKVRLVERDQPVRLVGTQTNPTWGLDRVDERTLPLDNTYTYANSGGGVHVYVVDTGIRATHNEFGGRVGGGFTSINDGRGTNDCNGHGTHVAGTVGGQLHGVAKGVALHAVRVLNCSGSGSTSGVIAGVDWVTAKAVKPAVANMSLGGSASNALDSAVRNSIQSGVTYVVAAGNDGKSACLQSPARVGEALTVGAASSTDARASWSNYGSCLDLFAPGVGILSAYHQSNTSTASLSGTSMASPHVAGAAALYLATSTGAQPSAVAQALVDNATTNVVSGAGSGSPNRMLYTGFIGGSPPPPPPGNSIILYIHGGNNQSADVNTTLPDPLTVRVTDASGNLANGVAVTFTVTAGGGQVRNGPDVTGPKGIATSNWQLGPTAGTQTVEVTAPGAAPITFTATANGGPPPPPTVVLHIMGGNNQTGTAGERLPDLLDVLVTDQQGNPLGGVAVSFTVLTGGGTVRNGPDTTGSKGVASSAFILGPDVGTQTVQATAQGANPITFTATAN